MSCRQIVDVVEPVVGYTRLAGEYKKRHKHLDAFATDMRRRFLPRDLSKCHILDIGSADGRLYKYFSNTQFASYTACDIVPELLALHPNGQNVHKIVCDANKDLPFSDQSFDVVLSFFVIEYLDDLFHFGSEIARILTPTGIVLIGHFLQRREMVFVYNKKSYKIKRTNWRKEEILDAMQQNFLTCIAHPVLEETREIGWIFVAKK